MVPAEAGHEVGHDVLVIGGGPAGCAAATMLARLGHRIALLSKPAGDLLALGESIPPSTQKLFDVLGLGPAIDAADFIRATGNTVWWGGDAPRVEYFAQGQRGWQVTNTALEAILRTAAAAAGVHFVSAVADVASLGALQTGAAPDRPKFLLDCSGRSGVMARARRLRVYDDPHSTVAMVGVWRSDQFDLPDPTHTLIESYEGGWVWSVPRSATERFVAAMVDPRVSGLSRSVEPGEVYVNELRKAARMHRALQRAELVDGPRGWHASMYRAWRYVDDNVVLVGDAGSFIDPLSSAGIKKALASGWLAAVATHTSLIKPHMRAIALEFFDQREREIYDQFRAMTESYWRDAAGGHSHPFWSDRVADVDAVRNDAGVQAAFERLRTTPRLIVESDPSAHVAHRAAVGGAEIVLEPRLVRSDRDAGARFSHDVDLIALVQLAPSFTSVPDLFAAYNRQAAPVALPDFLAALATAIAHQWLRWCDTN